MIVTSIFLVTILVNSNSFAQSSGQSSDDYVRTTTTVPDLLAAGWMHDSTQSEADGRLITEIYTNNSQGLFAMLMVEASPRVELLLQFATRNVARAALKVDGVWYSAKGPFLENRISNVDNYFQFEPIRDSQGKETSIKVSLDTVEGLKSVTVLVE